MMEEEPVDEVLLLMLRDRDVLKALRHEYGKQASIELVDALLNGRPTSEETVNWSDFLYDLLWNSSRLYKRFHARGSFGNFPIDILGLGGLYFTRAPEFDDEGPFTSFAEADDSVLMNWTDSLVSSDGRVYRTPFEHDVSVTSSEAELVTSDIVEARRIFWGKPQFKHGSARLSQYQARYYFHGRGQFCQAHFVSAPEAAKLIFESKNTQRNPSSIGAKLMRLGWDDVLAELKPLEDEAALEKERKEEELLAEQTKQALEFNAFFQEWLASSPEIKGAESLKKAAWAYVVERGGFSKRNDDDIPLRHLAQSARSVLASWYKHFGDDGSAY